LKLGHVYIIETVLTKPPKAKFAICVSVGDGFFVWINSRARAEGHDQLPIAAGCHSLIRHESHIDLSRIVCHQPYELANAQEFEMISRDLRDAIVNKIGDGLMLLPPVHSRLIAENLRSLYQTV